MDHFTENQKARLLKCGIRLVIETENSSTATRYKYHSDEVGFYPLEESLAGSVYVNHAGACTLNHLEEGRVQEFATHGEFVAFEEGYYHALHGT